MIAGVMRQPDGSAGDANYGIIGATYSRYRQPEPAIELAIRAALGPARTLLNVGAGAGSYEPLDLEVTAVEPSASMRAQRPAGLAAAIDATAENLPFHDKSFDASLATFTVHQWSDLAAGLGEMRRVTRGAIVILTCDPHEVTRFWLHHYAPEVLEAEARRYPKLQALERGLGGRCEVRNVRIPLNCRDGFNEAYHGRPEKLLDSEARLSCSAWSFVDAATTEAYIDHLGRDLTSGAWDEAHGRLRTQAQFDGSLRLVVSDEVGI